jgi:DNA-directed RNA polymerase subunit RPC12/RpoP
MKFQDVIDLQLHCQHCGKDLKSQDLYNGTDCPDCGERDFDKFYYEYASIKIFDDNELYPHWEPLKTVLDNDHEDCFAKWIALTPASEIANQLEEVK